MLSSAKDRAATESPELSESSLESLSSSWWPQSPGDGWWALPGHSSGAWGALVWEQEVLEVRCRCSSVQLRLCACGTLALLSRGPSTCREERGECQP